MELEKKYVGFLQREPKPVVMKPVNVKGRFCSICVRFSLISSLSSQKQMELMILWNSFLEPIGCCVCVCVCLYIFMHSPSSYHYISSSGFELVKKKHWALDVPEKQFKNYWMCHMTFTGFLHWSWKPSLFPVQRLPHLHELRLNST